LLKSRLTACLQATTVFQTVFVLLLLLLMMMVMLLLLLSRFVLEMSGQPHRQSFLPCCLSVTSNSTGSSSSSSRQTLQQQQQQQQGKVTPSPQRQSHLGCPRVLA
jgi:hypothetical protein